MPDGSDPGRVERYAERERERIRLTVREPNKNEILKTIRKGERGNIPSPKPHQQTKSRWEPRTIQNNARNLRILAGEIQGLDAAEYDGITWPAVESDRDKYPDRLLDLDGETATDFITNIAIDRDIGQATERDYCLSLRNHFLSHGKEDEAKKIHYPQVGQSNVAVDVDTVPTREDLMKLIEGESARDKALFTVLWETGNRVTAMCSLKVKHWMPKGDSYGVIQLPTNVVGLKGADLSAKPITFSRGYLEGWLAEHPLADDPDAPLFCPTRSQDDPSEHLHPHSIRTQMNRISRRTDGLDPDLISPHKFKHGRASEMRASEKYDKDDIEQILDWEEGTPMHSRYEHVTEEDEAERILRKHGFEPAEGGDTVEQHECPRCGTVVSTEAKYCPQCSLRQDDERPRWWRIYRKATDEDDMVRELYDDEIPPGSLSQLPPGYYDHAVGVLISAGTHTTIDPLPVSLEDLGASEDILEDAEPIDEEDIEWLAENYADIFEEHTDHYPGARELRGE